MVYCKICNRHFSNYDSDAGTYKEHFCSEHCANVASMQEDLCEAIQDKKKLLATLSELREGFRCVYHFVPLDSKDLKWVKSYYELSNRVIVEHGGEDVINRD